MHNVGFFELVMLFSKELMRLSSEIVLVMLIFFTLMCICGNPSQNYFCLRLNQK